MSNYVMTDKDFLAKLNLALHSKTLYVNSAFGAPATPVNKARYKKNQSASRQAKIDAASADTFFFDCVCLVKGILWGWDADPLAIYGGAEYASNGVPDMTINAITSQCGDYSSYIWDNLVPGEWLHLNGEHCGVYVGDGLAIECTPNWDDGVQLTAVGNIGSKVGYPTRNWTGHGKLPWVEYNVQPKPQPTDRVPLNGVWDHQDTAALQIIFDCQIIDGVVSRQPKGNKQYLPNVDGCFEFKGWPWYIGGSALIKAMQTWIGAGRDGYAGKEFVTKWQIALRDNNYYHGAIDGSFGPQTALATEEYINDWFRRHPEA